MGQDLDPMIVRMLLDYEPETGLLIWKERPRTRFRENKSWVRFNQKNAGQKALEVRDRQGYKHGTIFRRDYRAHRVAWAAYYGRWPTLSLDHINGDPADNRISNLREVSAFENQRNAKRRSDNKTGRTGVVPYGARWAARITVNRRPMQLGVFDHFEDAVAARVAAERKYGFHENHGRIAA